MTDTLQPLPYHFRLRDFLRGNHREIWEWFSSAEAESDYSEAVQLELLKATYRLGRADHEVLYRLTDEVKERLGIAVPVTLYQSQDGGGPGQATLYFTPGHGHVVFGGGILDLLDEKEERALLGHELAHFRLWTESNGDFLVADRVLATMAGEPRAEPSHHESARLYRLYTEIYADRGSLLVSDSVETVVGTLMKTVTGMKEVNPSSYLKQAEEIFAKAGDQLKSGGLSHPEAYVRARAAFLWSNAGLVEDTEPAAGEEESKDIADSVEEISLGKEAGSPDGDLVGEEDSATEGSTIEEPVAENPETEGSQIGATIADTESEIEQMIEGGWSLDDLDLTRQSALADLTRELLRHLLAPEWTRTGRTLAHAKLYFSDFKPDETRHFETMEELAEKFRQSDEKTRHYLAHVLLDFAVADRELDENGLALAFVAAEKFDLADTFDKAARKELKILKRLTTAIRKNAVERLERAAEEHEKLSKKEKAAIKD